MNADYIFVRDLDQLPCATAARDRLLAIFPQVSPDRVQIVKAELCHVRSFGHRARSFGCRLAMAHAADDWYRSRTVPWPRSFSMLALSSGPNSIL